MKKLSDRTGLYFPFLTILLCFCGASSQTTGNVRIAGPYDMIESVDLRGHSNETSEPRFASTLVSNDAGIGLQRVTPTSKKGEVPVQGDLQLVGTSDEVNRHRKIPAPLNASAVAAEELNFPETDEGTSRFLLPNAGDRPRFHPRHFTAPNDEYHPIEEDDEANGKPKDRFHWKPAIEQSLMIQGVQHGYALLFQEKTRRALKGKFFEDYVDSIKGLRGWSDGNKFFTNYIAHPMQGAMTGFIFLQNHDRMKKQKFGESKQYWKDRFKAFVWSTAWSTNWELGPISQSSIGNVGLYDHQGYVDLVMTPTAGTGWMVMEEALDRYLVRHIEKRSAVVKIFARMLLNPMRSVANVLRFQKPWYRDRPFGD